MLIFQSLLYVPFHLSSLATNLSQQFANPSIVKISSPPNMGILGALGRHFDTLVGPGVMLLYPLYASVRAIESPSTLDDQQWLTYWVLYSFITLFELFCWKFLAWFPVWPYLKLLFCMWLVLPIFNGAAYIYGNWVRRYVNIGTFKADPRYPENYKRALQMMSLDARKSVERFVETHGIDAFEKVVHAAQKEARSYDSKKR